MRSQPLLVAKGPEDDIGPRIDIERLRARLKETKYSQPYFAVVAGMSPRTLQNIFAGYITASLRHRYFMAIAIRRLKIDDGTIISGNDGLVNYNEQPTGEFAAIVMEKDGTKEA